MKLLSAERQCFAYIDGMIVAGLHEDRGYRRYSVFALRDDELLAGSDDLEGLLVDEVHGAAIPEHKPL